MQYRPLGPGDDYTVGIPFLANSPQTVGQAILTRLKLWKGEFFLDTSDGTPYLQNILGPRAGSSPDAAIQQRILGTPHVQSISSYSSAFDGTARSLTVSAVAVTDYGPVTVQTVLT